MDKCAKLSIRGQTQNYELMGTRIESSKTIKDLGIYVSHDLTWKTHIEERLKEANKVLYLLRRNIVLHVRQQIKLGLYNSLILPVLLHGSACTNPNRGELQQLETFQMKVVKWILGQKVMPYPNQLSLLNILPLPMFMQLNDILHLSKLTEDDSFLPMLRQNSEKGRTNELLKLPKTRTEKARNDFLFRTCRLANRIEKYIEFNTKKGLKNRVLNFMRKFVNKRFDENNICSWHLCCDCQICRNNRTIF